jgi:hypothetical protein
MPAGKIVRDLAVEERRIVEKAVSLSPPAPCGIGDSRLYGPPDKLREGEAGCARVLNGRFFQTGRQDQRGSLHNYVYIIA